MIWTVVLWMAMQGQRANEPNAAILVEPNVICNEWLPDSHGSCDSAPTQFKYLKPVEHVFEIRTKREDHGNYNYACRKGDVLEGINLCSTDSFGHTWDCLTHCIHITRELYMDGRRLGTILGLQ